MPEVINLLPFPNIRYYSEDNSGNEFGVIVLKGTFQIRNGELFLAEEQAPLALKDHYHGAASESSLLYPSDLVPNKPTADVIINAVAYSPGGTPRRTFECGVRISGLEGVILEKKLRVCGPRSWIPKWRRKLSQKEIASWSAHKKRPFQQWELTEPEAVSEVPLIYELANGGTYCRGVSEAGEKMMACDERNPIGRGLINSGQTDHTEAKAAPQIEAADGPPLHAYGSSEPQGFGAIPPAWEPRLSKAGTYDDHWQQNVWPR